MFVDNFGVGEFFGIFGRFDNCCLVNFLICLDIMLFIEVEMLLLKGL